MEKREEYQGKMEAQLGEWGKEIDKLKAKADKVAADTRQGYYEEIETLRAKQTSMQAKLQELKASQHDGWRDIKQELDHYWYEINESLQKAADRFK